MNDILNILYSKEHDVFKIKQGGNKWKSAIWKEQKVGVKQEHLLKLSDIKRAFANSIVLKFEMSLKIHNPTLLQSTVYNLLSAAVTITWHM